MATPAQNLVLDLDETVLHTYNNYERWAQFECKYGEEKFQWPCITNQDIVFYGVLRPNIKSFLGWCSGNYDQIGIWSAGKKEYVETMVVNLFTGRRPDFIWSWDDCDAYYDGSELTFTKPLEFVYDSIPNCNPKNTIFIDDADHSDLCNAGNMITITPFNPERFKQVPDTSLLTLKKFLRVCKNKKDIRTIEKRTV